MPTESEKPLKMRAYKLSDETVELLQLVADALTEQTGIKCYMTDALRISISKHAELLGVKLPKKKK